MPGHSNNSRPPLPTPTESSSSTPTPQWLETFTLFGISCHTALLPISGWKRHNSPLERSESEPDEFPAWFIPEEGDGQYQLASLLIRLRGDKITSLSHKDDLFRVSRSVGRKGCGERCVRSEFSQDSWFGEKAWLVQSILASLAIRGFEHPGNSVFACRNHKNILPTKNLDLEAKTPELGRNSNTYSLMTIVRSRWSNWWDMEGQARVGHNSLGRTPN